ncbi:hypothetical protein CANARDRAFT_6478 [[Candida] arabinofermentans NRRL YB-2248]|uniref:Mto2p-binding domain-containing protein n=1 Tax=[Candida] arabinofermentans NRRL YB-2248 TaxID=983967 RepID=A0A1E4T5G4_9ASCO|nr:hypothetical protein CANARDRAFT_6478 [[Candida] arabinofermentans NRRL YB-2248]
MDTELRTMENAVGHSTFSSESAMNSEELNESTSIKVSGTTTVVSNDSMHSDQLNTVNTSGDNSELTKFESRRVTSLSSRTGLLDLENTKVLQLEDYKDETSSVVSDDFRTDDQFEIPELSSFNISSDQLEVEETQYNTDNETTENRNDSSPISNAWTKTNQSTLSGVSMESSLTRLTPIKLQKQEQMSARSQRRQQRLISTQILRAKLAGSPTNGDNDADNNDDDDLDNYDLDIDNTVSIPFIEMKSSNTTTTTTNVPKTPVLHTSNSNILDLGSLTGSMSFGDIPVTKSTAATHEIEKLQKELTNCRIQLSLQSKLLQDRYGEDSTSIMKTIEENFMSKIDSDSRKKEIDILKEKLKDNLKNYSEVSNQNTTLRNEIDEIFKEFEGLQDEMEIIREDHEDCKAIINGISGLLLEKIDDEMLDSSSLKENASMKLQLSSIGYIIENFLCKIVSNNNSLKAEATKKDEVIERLNQRLITFLEKLQMQNTKYDEMKSLLDLELLKDRKVYVENQSLKISLKKKEEAYNILQHEKELLTVSLNELHSIQTKIPQGSEDSDLHARSMTLKSQIEVLEAQNKALLEQLAKTKNENTAGGINELKYKADIDGLNQQLAVLEKNLNSSLAKQRQSNSERIKLGYKIDKLTKTIAELEAVVSDHQNINAALEAESDSMSQQLSDTRSQLQYLLTSDVNFQTHLIKILSKVLDRKSIKEAAEKILQLADRDQLSLDADTVNKIYDTIFQYDLSAIQAIVNNHVKLTQERDNNPGKETDSAGASQRIIQMLEGKVSQLTALLNEAKGKENKDDPTLSSPRSKLRFDELTKRWKIAEEALSFEKKNSKKRLDELETENTRLRSQLSSANVRL